LKYVTYWTISDTPSHAIQAHTIFLILSILSISSWLKVNIIKRQKNDLESSILRWSLFVIGIFSLSMFVLLKINSIKHPNTVSSLLNSKNVRIAEGLISDFNRSYREARYGTITGESFKVDSVLFKYEDAALVRFNSFAKTNNGIFHDGLPVRITYIKDDSQGNWILKIEIGNSD
jgi:hypothetical protein